MRKKEYNFLVRLGLNLLSLPLSDHKVIGFDLVDNDRTVVLQFHNHKVILELYAKGNLILLNNENKIIVLTRIYRNCSHGKDYIIKDYKQDGEDFVVEKFGWAKKDKEINNLDLAYNADQLKNTNFVTPVLKLESPKPPYNNVICILIPFAITFFNSFLK